MDTNATNAAAAASVSTGTGIMAVMFLLFWAFMYFVPTVIGAVRKHRNIGPIAAVNILLGWTVLGWIWAFIWSLMSPPAPTVVINQSAPPPSA